MEGGDFVRVDKLQKGDEWPAWKFEICVLLRAAEVMDVVSGKNKKPERGTSQSQGDHDAALLKWHKSDNKAQRIIVTALGKLPKVHVLNCDTANSMWTKLESVYEKKSRATIHFTTQKFFNFTKEPEDDIATFISKLQAVVKQMSDLGETISDSMVMTKILSALPEELNHFPSAWESTAENLQTIDNLTARLVMEEARVERKQESEAHEVSEAFVARNFHKKNFRNSSFKPGKCHICKQSGHWKNECPAKSKSTEKQSSATSSKRNSRDPADACLAFKTGSYFGRPAAHLSLSEALTATYRKNSDDWFLDSGASDHMSYRFEWFVDYRPFDKDLPVRIGNGSYIFAKGIGTIDILAYDNNKWCTKHLTDVLYVPEIHLNLFSQGKALDKDMTMVSDKLKCEFSRNGSPVLVGVRESNLFKLMFKVVVESKSYSVSKETNFEGNSENGRWVASSNSKHKSHGTTGGNVSCKVSLSTWHERLGHQNIGYVKNFLRSSNIAFNKEKDFFCEACVYGKHHRSSFNRSCNRAQNVGELVHTDVCGPMQEKSIGGARYFVLFKDDFSNFRTVYFLKQKSEVCQQIQKYLTLVKSTKCTISVVRSDNGTEFVNLNVKELFEQQGIRHQRSVPYTPEHNGRAEREMRTIVESARTMIHARKLSLKFWAEAVNAAVYVLNCTGPSPVSDKTPFELFFERKPSVEHLRVFGADVFVHIPKEKRRKWNVKARKGIFVGYDDNIKGYRVYIPDDRKIEVSRDVVFKENTKNNDSCVSVVPKDNSADNFVVFGPSTIGGVDYTNEGSDSELIGNQEVLVEPVQDEDFDQSQEGWEDCEGFENLEDFSFLSDTEDETPESSELKWQSFVSNHTRSQTALSACMEIGHIFVSVSEPSSYKMALKSNENVQWCEAMDDEYNSLMENRTWDLVDLPRGRNVIDNKWVYKVKETPSGEIERYKARLVVRGFTQEHGVDYDETFSPVVRHTSVRTIMAMAVMEDLKMRHFDVKTAFLYGELNEVIYMKQPIGYEDGTSKVCLLRKSLYGLKQASRSWNEKFTNFLRSYNLKASSADPCVFVSIKSDRKIVLGVFIDDGMVAATYEEDIDKLMDFLTKEFEIRVMEAKYFVGLEIEQRRDGSIHLSQKAYIRRVLEKFRMADAKSVATPAENIPMSTTDPVEKYPFREAVGSLMYLTVGTRPDISFAVGKVSRYLNNPTEASVTAVKRIFKYLRGTLDYGIIFEKHPNYSLECYSDSDYAGDPETRRSTSGYVFMLGSGAISWSSQLQKCVVTSSTEAEYVAGSQSVKEMVWLKKLMSDLHIKCETTTLHMDNQSAIRLVKNPEFHKRTKHIDVMYHFIREKFTGGFFELNYVPTDDQIADIFTKALSRVKFEKFRSLMNLCR